MYGYEAREGKFDFTDALFFCQCSTFLLHTISGYGIMDL